MMRAFSYKPSDVLEQESDTMTKAEPKLAEASTEPDPTPMIIFNQELSALRSENIRLKANASTAALNDATNKKNNEHLRKENLKLQEQPLAAQESVYALRNKLLSLREIVNSA
jgi:hypothetical protein